MKRLLVTMVLMFGVFFIFGRAMTAQNNQLVCEVRIAKPKEETGCLHWKTSGGKPTDIAGRSEPQTLKILLPDGKQITMKAQSVIVFTEEDAIVNSIDFHLAGDDSSYTDALDNMIDGFKENGLFAKLDPNVIDRMRSDPAKTLYPTVALSDKISLSGTIKKSVVTNVPSKDQSPTAKIWRVQMRLSYFKDGIPK